VSRRLALFALVLGFAASIAELGWPFARAAEPTQRVVRVGLVSADSPSTVQHLVSVFLERLRALGWVEGQNLIFEPRYAEGSFDRLPALMAEVVGQKVDVLFTWTTPGAIAAKNATRTTPIVALGLGDPVRAGLVESLSRPGGNLTGTSLGISEGMMGKLLELLQEMVPQLSTVAVIANPDNPIERVEARDIEAIAPKRRLKVQIIEVREAEALDAAFQQAARRAQAVLVVPNPITMMNRTRITALAAKHGLPAMYGLREFVDAGGLMAYGPDTAAMFRQAAEHVDKILRGAQPGDLPIEEPTRYLLVVNLKTARALGLTIPQSILLQANEVIR